MPMAQLDVRIVNSDAQLVVQIVAADDTLLALGNDNDAGLYLRSTALSADAEITSVIVGTSDHQGVAANSLLVTNITQDGDIGFYVNIGGNSVEAFLIDASASTIYLGFGTFTNVTYSAANSTNNTNLTVANTSNAAAASHSIVNIQVGGTTSTGDPQLRLTIPSGTSWYVGADNSADDRFTIGTGTTVGTAIAFTINTLTPVPTSVFQVFFWAINATLPNGATNIAQALGVQARTYTKAAGAGTTVTSLDAFVEIGAMTLAQTDTAITYNKAAGLAVVGPTAGASVTITHASGIRILTAGAGVNVSGLFIEAQTGGTTQNVQILLSNGSTEPTAAPTDTAGIYAIDVSAASVLGFVQETAVVTPAGDFALTSKWIVRINNATYAIGMTTVLT